MPLLKRSKMADKFIINVSSVEGEFYHIKMTTHPHTNMAKASFNMMTRTCAPYFAKWRIWINSVDTGWITDMNPAPRQQKIQTKHPEWYPPLDEIDGAARILDPIFTRLNGGPAHTGKFFKDYSIAPW